MSIKILKELGNNKYEVEIPEADKGLYQELSFQPVHDYMEFCDWSYAQKEDCSTHSIKYWTRITIPIRDFVKFMLPRILADKNIQEDHLKDRIHTEDDKYWDAEWQKGRFKGPRYKTGDTYPAYADDNVVIKYWEGKDRKIAVRLRGETEYTIMTPKMFELIKDKIGKEL